MNNTLTALKGVRVGHSTHLDKLTGCTVVLFDKPFAVAYKAYGGSTGTFNTDVFANGKLDNYAHGIFISGGSWYGLTSAGEILKALVGKGIGYKSRKIINPNLTGAIVYDLGTHIGQYDPSYAREAVENATYDEVTRGNVGAGTGTSVGKFFYEDEGKTFPGMKAGVGCARVDLGNGIIVTALSVVNAVGNIILPDGKILAGNRTKSGEFKKFKHFSDVLTDNKQNTTITIVGINANLWSRENYERIAHVATQGQTRAINPVNTSMDGDSLFVFSTEEVTDFVTKDATSIRGDGWSYPQLDIICQAAADAVQESIYDACYRAETIHADFALDGIVPSVKDK
ncbi:MAG TPA: P1 family peptidase [Patescibacteria group bacterium]|nr:P1 family peptidase [Patescibacteria group bacterium]